MVEYNRRELKYKAKAAIFTGNSHAFLASIAIFLLLYALNWLLTNLTGYAEWFSSYCKYVFSLKESAGAITFAPYTAVPWPKVGKFAILLCAVIAILRTVLSAGYTSWCIQAARGQEPSVKCIFDGFNHFGQVFVLCLVRAVITGVGLCIFIIPGIWLACRYRLALYVFFDEPDIGIFGALHRSAELSRGRKMQIFILDLSFIIWYLAADLIASLLLPVLDIWVRPYIGLTFAYYYDYVLAEKNGAAQ